MSNWEHKYIMIDESECQKRISFTWHGLSALGFRGEIKPYWIEPNPKELREEYFETKKVGWFHIGPISIHIDVGKRRVFRKKEQSA